MSNGDYFVGLICLLVLSVSVPVLAPVIFLYLLVWYK